MKENKRFYLKEERTDFVGLLETKLEKDLVVYNLLTRVSLMKVSPDLCFLLCVG